MTNIWAPLSTRLSGGALLREEVPAALATALRHWIEEVARDSSSLCNRALLRCNLARDPEQECDADHAEFLAWWTPDEALLDVVDALLDLLPTGTLSGAAPPAAPNATTGQRERWLEALARITFTKFRMPLQQLLDDGRSAYTIRPDGRSLVRRVDATVTALVNTAVRAAEQPNRGSASTHLERAFAAAHALHGPGPRLRRGHQGSGSGRARHTRTQ